MNFIKTYILAILIFAFPHILFAQSSAKNDSTYQEARLYLLDFHKNDTNNTLDSAFIQNMNNLDWFTQNDTLLRQFKTIQSIVSQNRAQAYQQHLQVFYDSLIIKKQLFDSLRNDYLTFESLIDQMDTAEISSSDTNFIDLINEVLDQPFNLDSLPIKDSAEVDLYKKYYQNDTLIEALKNSLYFYKKHEFLNWIKTMRRDTSNFYIVDLEGDSLLIQLYDANPNLVRFEISDYWGSTINAVIRNIHSNSFRVLIDDAPSIEYQTSEKAITALSKLKKKNNNLPQITIQKQDLPENIKPWLIYGNGNLDLSQIGMYQWAQGGEATVSFVAGTELFAKYNKQNQNWDTHMRLGYGVIRQGRYQDTSENFKPHEDRIELNSKYGIKLFKHYNLTVEGDFKSQFAPHYEWDGNTRKEMISRFMSPGYAMFSLGLDYLKYDNFTLFLSPASSKTTFVLDTSISIKGRYNVDTTGFYRGEFGMRIRATHSFKVWTNIEIKNKLELYSNYLYKPKNIDVNWEMNIVFPVNDFIQATLATHLIYDDDQNVPKYRWKEVLDETGSGTGNYQWEKHESPGLQFKEAIRLGLMFRF